MRVCITGGGGYFGQYVARTFQKEGHHTVLLDLAFSQIPSIQLEERLTVRIEGSILEKNCIKEALAGCDICVHLAAYGMSGAAAVEKEKIFQVNVEGTRLLMEVCRQLCVQRFVFASSVAIVFIKEELHDSDENLPYPAEEEYFSHYGCSKAQAEKEVLASNSPSFQTIALRFRGIFGCGEPRSTDRAANMIQNGLLVATFDKNGESFTQYSGVDNCCSAIILAEKAMRKSPGKCAGQTYNIVDEGPVSSLGFWSPLIKGLGQEPAFLHISYQIVYFFAYLAELLCIWTGIPPIMNRLEVNLVSITNTYSIEKAKTYLGYKPKRNHDISKIVEHYCGKSRTRKSFETTPFFSGFPISMIVFGIFTMMMFSFA